MYTPVLPVKARHKSHSAGVYWKFMGKIIPETYVFIDNCITLPCEALYTALHLNVH